MEKKFEFDTSFQAQILNLMMQDETFLSKCSIYIKNEYFENEHLGKIFEWSLAYHKRYERTPDTPYFLNEIKKFKESERYPYIETFHKVITASQLNPAYVKDQLTEFVKRNQFVKLYNKLPEVYAKDPEAAYRDVLKNAEEITTFTFSGTEKITLEDSESLSNELMQSTSVVPVGIPTIDAALGNGATGGELVVFLGDSNVGKSIILINVGANHLLTSKDAKVLHINLEGKKSIPVHRYHARLSQIPYNRLKYRYFENDSERERYERAKELTKDRLYIVHMNDFKVTIEDLYAKMKEIYKTFQFTTVILDYGDLLSTQEKMEYRHSQTAVFRGLAKIAGFFGVPTFTASQATRPEGEYTDKHWLTPRSVSESYEKVRVSSIIITINRSEREEQENKLRFLLCKNRDGIKNVKAGCYSDYSKMTPYSHQLGFYNPDTEVGLVVEEKK